MSYRKDVWIEVALSLLIRGVWSGFFVAMGIFINDIHRSKLALALTVTGTVFLLGLALTFEYRRAQIRLRRVHENNRPSHVRSVASEGSSTTVV